MRTRPLYRRLLIAFVASLCALAMPTAPAHAEFGPPEQLGLGYVAPGRVNHVRDSRGALHFVWSADEEWEDYSGWNLRTSYQTATVDPVRWINRPQLLGLFDNDAGEKVGRIQSALDAEGNLHMAWGELTASSFPGEQQAVHYARRTADGILGEPRRIGYGYDISMAVGADGAVHIAWGEASSSVRLATISPSGDVLTLRYLAARRIVEPDAAASATVRLISPGADGGPVRAVWTDNYNPDVYSRETLQFTTRHTSIASDGSIGPVHTHAATTELARNIVAATTDSHGTTHILTRAYEGGYPVASYTLRIWRIHADDSVRASIEFRGTMSTDNGMWRRHPDMAVDAEGVEHLVWQDGSMPSPRYVRIDASGTVGNIWAPDAKDVRVAVDESGGAHLLLQYPGHLRFAEVTEHIELRPQVLETRTDTARWEMAVGAGGHLYVVGLADGGIFVAEDDTLWRKPSAASPVAVPPVEPPAIEPDTTEPSPTLERTPLATSGCTVTPFSRCATADRILGGGASDQIWGGAGDDVLIGSGGDDVLVGEGGDDTLLGGSGSDVLTGGAGNDRIVGGTGMDSVRSGDGNDRINVRDGRPDTVWCGAGIDRVTGDRRDRLIGCELRR